LTFPTRRAIEKGVRTGGAATVRRKKLPRRIEAGVEKRKEKREREAAAGEKLGAWGRGGGGGGGDRGLAIPCGASDEHGERAGSNDARRSGSGKAIEGKKSAHQRRNEESGVQSQRKAERLSRGKTRGNRGEG